ncbi:lipid-A-disaccharide synthase [Solimonas terrae]|uniref:Lipid-A-disaccharide synthase n=1 Tax=Solimonas terrae TaxID=1396819 RepID=A0A6M2BMU6_9GAMM|nr:lipid-A-disaccharide synthase [Solimonas terrae]NGY03551.1 lipid-A-disaccharide synthase [Solimonas terrae]
MLRIALVAGELSGDLLGGALVAALRERFPAAHFYGVTGARMTAAGCESIASIDALSVMGITEVLPALPRILRLRRDLVARFSADRPDLVIGIDAPDFNLGLERRLRDRGIRTVHVVSPTVWAWRAGRVKTIARAVERILCLFPFEPDFYARHGAPDKAVYIGHPLADELDAGVTPTQARAALGLPLPGPLVAVLPGSRGSELKYLAEPLVRAAALIAAQMPGARFVTPIAKPALRARMQAAIASHAPTLSWTLLDGQSRDAMRAADAVLIASGTATLECLLLGRPMIVAYRGAPITAWLLLSAGMLKTPYVSLPNLLTDRPVVPEFLQGEVKPELLAEAVLSLLREPAARDVQLQQFDGVRSRLRCDAARRAADVLGDLLQSQP